MLAVIIAIDENLHHIKTGLQQLGYSVVDLKENQLTDVIIYYRDSQSNIFGGNLHNSFLSGLGAESGTLLINGYGKTLEEIQEIIKNRSYSPLFTNLE